MHQHIPIEIDPPDFRKYRKILNLITSPSAAERMSDVVLDYTTSFIDDVIEAGECDFASVIGVPAAVTIHWLGLPVQDWHLPGPSPRMSSFIHARCGRVIVSC